MKLFARVSKVGPGYRRSVFLPVIVRVYWAIRLVLSHRSNFVCAIFCSAALFSHHGRWTPQNIVKIDSLMASGCVFVVAECESIAQLRGDGDEDEKRKGVLHSMR